MAPLGDRDINRQSRLPTASSSSNPPRTGANNENTPPQSSITRLLVPTKSTVARSKSPSSYSITTNLNPRVATGAESPFRGRLYSTKSSDNLSASISNQLRRPSPSPVMDALNARKPRSESPTVPLHNLGRAQSKKTYQKSKPANIGKPLPVHPANRIPYEGTSAGERLLRQTSGSPKGQDRPKSSLKCMPSQNSAVGVSRISSSRLPRSPAMSIMGKPSDTKVASPPLIRRPTKIASPRMVSPRPTPVATSQEQSSRDKLSVPREDPEKDYPPRSSSLRQNENNIAEIGLGITTEDSSTDSIDSLERRHLPPVGSFSQPRVRHPGHSRPSSPDKLPTPQNSDYATANNAESISRIPMLDPSKTPELVSPRPEQPGSTSERSPNFPDTNNILTFASRRLGNASDLAVLDQSTARSSKYRASTDKACPQKKSNLNLKNLPTGSPSFYDNGKLSPIRFFFGDKSSPASDNVDEFSRVKHISGNLLSSSFAGSTLTISDDADHLILGPSEDELSSESATVTPAQSEFELPSPSSKGFHVSWPADFGFSHNLGQVSPTVQSSPSIRNETMAKSSSTRVPRISEESEAGQDPSSLEVELTLSVALQDKSSSAMQKTMGFPIGSPLTADSEDNFLPGATITADDENSHQHITATLSLLEGTPVKQAHQEDCISHSSPPVGKGQLVQQQDGEKSRTSQLTAPPAPPTKQVTKQLSVAKLPRANTKMASDSDESPVRPRSDRLPSYMLPTPASEARRLSTAPTTDPRRTNTTRGATPNTSDRRASKIGRLTPTPTLDSCHTSPSLRLTPTPESHRVSRVGRLTPSAEARPGSATSSSDTRTASITSRLSIARLEPQRSPQNPTTAPGRVENSIRANATKRISTVSTKGPRHITLPQLVTEDPSKIPKAQSSPFTDPESAKESSRPTSVVKSSFRSKHNRAESRTKAALSNIKGLFSSRRDVPPTPALDGRRSFSASKTSFAEPEVPPMPKTRRKSIAKSISSRKDVKIADDEDKETSKQRPSSTTPTPTSEKRQTVVLMEMGLTLREEAFKESDIARKERMATFAQVMLDTVTSAVEAERNMYAAMQAAEQAQLSYQMTQRSVVEMSRLISNSRRLPNLFRKTNTTTSTIGLR